MEFGGGTGRQLNIHFSNSGMKMKTTNEKCGVCGVCNVCLIHDS